MRHTLFLTILAAGLVSLTSVSAETVHPSGTNIAASYSLSGTALTTNDTLVISRSIVNRESFALSGLYLSDNLPPQLSIVGAEIKLNGAPLVVADSAGSILSGYVSHCWLVGTPGGGTDMNPGDSLSLELKVTCAAEGTYALPLHTTVGYGNGDGFFAADSAAAITVAAPADITPPSAISNLSVAAGH